MGQVPSLFAQNFQGFPSQNKSPSRYLASGALCDLGFHALAGHASPPAGP